MSWRKREEVELMIMGVGQVEKGHYERERGGRERVKANVSKKSLSHFSWS